MKSLLALILLKQLLIGLMVTINDFVEVEAEPDSPARLLLGLRAKTLQ